MPALYDLMLLLDPRAADEQRGKILADTEAAIGSEGTLVTTQDWGTRALAYEIDHRGDAEYHLYQFNATPALLERLQRTLKLTDGIVRFRIIKLDPGTPPPPTVHAEAPRPAEQSEPAAPTAPAPAEPVAAAAPQDAPDEAPAADAPPAE